MRSSERSSAGWVSQRQCCAPSISSKWAAGAQSFVLFALLIVTAYGLYLPQWVGTLQEMIGILVWAFLIDVSAESALPIIRKVVPVGK